MRISINLAIVFAVCQAAAAEDRPNLTATFGNRVESLLLSRDSWRPFPTAADRKFWEAVPNEVCKRLIADGEVARAKPWEPITATVFFELLPHRQQGRLSACELRPA